MSVSIVQQVPTLTSTSLAEFVSGLITAASKGIRIFISASLLEKLKPLFDKLGIEVREVNQIPVDTYILIKHVGGIRIRIEVYENGNLINSVQTTIKAFEKALLSIIERQKGDSSQPGFYELILPKEFEVSSEEESVEEEEDSDEE